MFDISFAEILIIAIVALIVVGPQRLPKVARTLGYLFGRAQRYADNIKRDIRHEMELEELKKLKNSMQEATHTFDDTIRQEINQLQETRKTPAFSVPPQEIVTVDRTLTEFNTVRAGPASKQNPEVDDATRKLPDNAGSETFK